MKVDPYGPQKMHSFECIPPGSGILVGYLGYLRRGWDFLDLYLNWHVVNNPPVIGYRCIYIYIYIYLLSHTYIYI